MILSPDRFRVITHNYSSFDTDVHDALVQSQEYLEQQTDRFFELRDEAGVIQTRVESLKIHGDGLVYPHATPIRSVVLPLGLEIVGPGVRVAAGALSTGVRGFRYPWQVQRFTLATTGGYEATAMPESIVMAVAELAQFRLKVRSTSSLIPIGATSIKLGDVTLSGANLSTNYYTELSDHLQAIIAMWKRREV